MSTAMWLAALWSPAFIIPAIAHYRGAADMIWATAVAIQSRHLTPVERAPCNDNRRRNWA